MLRRVFIASSALALIALIADPGARAEQITAKKKRRKLPAVQNIREGAGKNTGKDDQPNVHWSSKAGGVRGSTKGKTAPSAHGKEANKSYRRVTMVRIGLSGFAWLAAALAAASTVSPADANETMLLRVPVKLKKLLPEVASVKVGCVPRKGNISVGIGYAERNISGGALDEVVEVIAKPQPNKTLVGVDNYTCWFQIRGEWWENPRVGSPPNPKLWLLARPDEFFKSEFNHSVVPGKFNDGIAGPGDLTAPPKPKQ